MAHSGSKGALRAALFVGTFAFSAAAGAKPVAELTSEEFQIYMDWKDGSADERLAKDSDEQKMKKVAKSLGVPLDKLKAAIAAVEPVAGQVGPEAEKLIRGALGDTTLKGRVDTIEVNASQGHVVAGVRWKCGDARDQDKEAATVAHAVGSGAKVVKTLALWCVNDQGTKLFSAKIGRTNVERIDKAGIDRFASSRYIKLFEDVRRGPHT